MMMDTIDPSSGKVITSYPEHSASAVEKALENADKAFRDWRRRPLRERGELLLRVARILREEKTQLARLMGMEMGKPVMQGEAEIEKCAWVCSYYAEHGAAYLKPDIIPSDATRSYVMYEPLGVVLGIMPWNFPFWQVIRCAAPTLMAGNTFLLKHASNVCGCALALEKLFSDGGFPPGAFSALLVSNPRVAGVIQDGRVSAVSLTGSTQAGKTVAALAGAALKKTVLELGGADPYIVLKDADVERAAETCVASRLVNGGQSCVSAKRFIVEESVFKEFTQQFLEHMRAVRMGPPLEEGTTLGPMARHDLRDALHADVLESVKCGATALMGGAIPDGPGAFYPPTVLINVHKGMPAYEREMFGPVASIIRARDEEEAVHIANDSVYGLGAAVFSRDVARAEKLAVTAVQAGCCFVNEAVKSDPRLPFGGIKESGYGRELSLAGMREFVNAKTIYIG